MTENNSISFLDKIYLKMYDSLYTASIAKEAAQGGNNGIIIVGMLVVIIGLVGFILTKNKN